MKSLKKLASLVIVFAMLWTVVPASAVTLSDVSEADREAVSVLAAFNILTGFEDGTFRGEQTITRAEFAAVAMRFMGFGELAGVQTNTIFPDVPQTFWGSGYVQAAQQQGVIVGFPDGTFMPNAPVSYDQAVTMLMRALGYGPQAQETGFPTGYLFAAAQAGVTSGISRPPSGNAYRGVVANLVYRAMDAYLMERVVWGTGDRMYQVTNKVAVEEFLNARRIEDAVITDTPIMGGREDSVLVNGSRFLIANSTVADFLGIPALVYVSTDNITASQRLVHFAGPAPNSRTRVINPVQIHNLPAVADIPTGDDQVFTISVTAALDSTTRSNVRLAPLSTNISNRNTLGLIVNGEARGTVTAAMVHQALSAPWAEITLVQTDSHRAAAGAWDYDLLVVNAYRVFEVRANNTTAQRLTVESRISPATPSALNAGWNLEYGANHRTNRVTLRNAQGSVVDPRNLSAGDIVAYRMGGTGSLNFITGTVSDRTVTGRVSRVINERVYVVDGEVLVGAADLADVGYSGTFTVTANGFIMDFERDADESSHGIIANGIVNRTVTFFDATGDDSVSVDTATRFNIVRYDGTTVAGSANMTMAVLQGHADSSVLFASFTTNAAGQITEINFESSEVAAPDELRVGSANNQIRADSNFSVTNHTPIFIEVNSLGGPTRWIETTIASLNSDQDLSLADEVRVFERTGSGNVVNAVAIAGGVTLTDTTWRLMVITEIWDNVRDAHNLNRTAFVGYAYDGVEYYDRMSAPRGVPGFTPSATDLGVNRVRGSLAQPLVAILEMIDGEVFNVIPLALVENANTTNDAPGFTGIAAAAWTAHAGGYHLNLTPTANDLVVRKGTINAGRLNFSDGEFQLGTGTQPRFDVVSGASAISFDNDMEVRNWNARADLDSVRTAGANDNNVVTEVIFIEYDGEVVQMVLLF